MAHPYQPQKRVRAEPTYVYFHKRRRLPFIAYARADCSVFVRNLAKSRQVFAENRALAVIDVVGDHDAHVGGPYGQRGLSRLHHLVYTIQHRKLSL